MLHHIKNKLLKLCKEFCKENFNIKLVFTSFKIKNYFSYKDPIPDDLRSFLLHKFTCASCSSSYIGKPVVIDFPFYSLILLLFGLDTYEHA